MFIVDLEILRKMTMKDFIDSLTVEQRLYLMALINSYCFFGGCVIDGEKIEWEEGGRGNYGEVFDIYLKLRSKMMKSEPISNAMLSNIMIKLPTRHQYLICKQVYHYTHGLKLTGVVMDDKIIE